MLSEGIQEQGAEPRDLDDLTDTFGGGDGHGSGRRLVNPRARIGPRVILFPHLHSSREAILRVLDCIVRGRNRRHYRPPKYYSNG